MLQSTAIRKLSAGAAIAGIVLFCAACGSTEGSRVAGAAPDHPGGASEVTLLDSNQCAAQGIYQTGLTSRDSSMAPYTQFPNVDLLIRNTTLMDGRTGSGSQVAISDIPADAKDELWENYQHAVKEAKIYGGISLSRGQIVVYGNDITHGKTPYDGELDDGAKLCFVIQDVSGSV